MAYEPTVWVDDETPVNAENLNKLEQGVAEIHTAKENGELNGTPGKSAYQYAQDGGYTGTEEEFARKLAREINEIHIGTEAPTDENVKVWIDTDEEPEASGGAQADWNASEGEPGHVLNRTHYEEANEEIVGEYTGKWTIAETQGKRINNAKLEENKEYKVVFDGDIYYLTAAYNENDEVVYIGATYNYDDECYDYNAFPFVAEYDADNERISIYVSSIGTHSIKISKETKTIKRLDEQFMPLLTSPNGTKYKLSVADDGTLSATPTT